MKVRYIHTNSPLRILQAVPGGRNNYTIAGEVYEWVVKIISYRDCFAIEITLKYKVSIIVQLCIVF